MLPGFIKHEEKIISSIFIYLNLENNIMEVITISRPGKGRRDIDDEDSDIEMGDVGFGRVTDENGLASSVITPGELITDDPIWMRYGFN